MKVRILFFSVFILGVFLFNSAFAEGEERNVPTFSEVGLRIPAKVYIEEGKKQSVKIIAKSSTLKEIITEVKGRTLNIKFPNTNYFWKKFEPGKIEIYITMPEIDGLSVSGSGDIIAKDIETRILELAVSGSGNIIIDELDAKRVSSTISGSGDIIIKDGGVADDLSVSISGSGNVKAIGFEVNDVVVRVSGSGNCSVFSNGSIKARVAGSGDVIYKGNPSIDSSVAGSGRVKKM
ncbi:MAG: DUF2807 domain-containing protein [Bacteroidetes bacterium]|nr:DUF2807 domain-containing protein [Bacteroidota bacterium]